MSLQNLGTRTARLEQVIARGQRTVDLEAVFEAARESLLIKLAVLAEQQPVPGQQSAPTVEAEDADAGRDLKALLDEKCARAIARYSVLWER